MNLNAQELSCLFSDALCQVYYDRGNTFEGISFDRLGELVADRFMKRVKEFEGNKVVLRRIFALDIGREYHPFAEQKSVPRDFESTVQKRMQGLCRKIKITIIR